MASDSDSSVTFHSSTLDPGGVYALKPGTVGKIACSCTIHGKASRAQYDNRLKRQRSSAKILRSG